MQHAFLPASPELRSNVMMLSKHLSYSKRLLRNLSVSVSAIRRNSLLSNTPILPSSDSVMRHNVWCFIFAA
jgi:hypothetical protein